MLLLLSLPPAAVDGSAIDNTVSTKADFLSPPFSVIRLPGRSYITWIGARVNDNSFLPVFAAGSFLTCAVSWIIRRYALSKRPTASPIPIPMSQTPLGDFNPRSDGCKNRQRKRKNHEHLCLRTNVHTNVPASIIQRKKQRWAGGWDFFKDTFSLRNSVILVFFIKSYRRIAYRIYSPVKCPPRPCMPPNLPTHDLDSI